MQNTRVLHIHFGKEGGAERFFVNLVDGLGARGVEQRFIIRPGRTWQDRVALHGDVILNNFRRLSPSTPLLRWRVKQIIENWKPHAIMAWMPRASRLVPAESGPIKLTRLGDYPKHLRHFSNCDLLVTNTPGIAAHCQKLGWDRPIQVVSNFVSLVEPKPLDRKQFDTPEDAFLVAGSGRFVPRKGFDTLVKAVARLDNAWLWLAGAGEEEANLRALAKDLGIADRTRFLGWLNEPIHAVAAGNAYVMPSRHEPLGNVVLEAWHAGVPVVSSLSEGPSWFATDGEDSLLVPIDGDAEMAEALRRIRDENGLADHLVAGARNTLATAFSRDSIVDHFIEIFRSRR